MKNRRRITTKNNSKRRTVKHNSKERGKIVKRRTAKNSIRIDVERISVKKNSKMITTKEEQKNKKNSKMRTPKEQQQRDNSPNRYPTGRTKHQTTKEQ